MNSMVIIIPAPLSPDLPSPSGLISRLVGCGSHHSSFLSKRKSTSGKTWARTQRGNTPGLRNWIAQDIYFHETYVALIYMSPITGGGGGVFEALWKKEARA